jgi:hypothetical protein
MAKKLRIPNRYPIFFRITSKRQYEMLWTEDFKDRKTLGECMHEPPQIRIKTNENETQTFWTTFHEIIHAMSNEYDINLTENQVLKLEKSFKTFFRLNGVTFDWRVK